MITTFDVIHDTVDPAGILRAIRPAGRCVCVDTTAWSGPLTTPDKLRPLDGFSLSYCLPVSLAEGGTGLGTCGLAEPVLRGMATDAGFRSVRHVPINDPSNTIYELAC